MAGNALSAAQTQYLTPTLKAAGWRKRGRHYRWTAPNRDQAVISFHVGALTEAAHVEFVIEVALVPYRHWMMSLEYQPEGTPGTISGMFQGRVTPPEECRVDHEWWQVDPETVPTCGSLLKSCVGERLAPAMVETLGDPDLMVAAFPDRTLLPPQVRWQAGNEQFSAIALLVDRGPSPRLAAAIEEVERNYRADQVARVHRMLAQVDPVRYGHLAK
jgi:hypothetical protein